jgi:signal transduction histidine kinase
VAASMISVLVCPTRCRDFGGCSCDGPRRSREHTACDSWAGVPVEFRALGSYDHWVVVAQKWRWPGWLRPPAFQDPELTDRAALLHYALLATLTVSVGAMAFAPMEDVDLRGGVIAVAVMVVINVGGLWTIRRGYVRAVGWVYGLAVWALLAGLQFVTGTNPVLLAAGFVNVTLVVGYSVGSGPAFGFGSFAAVWIGATMWLQARGALPEAAWAARPIDQVIQAVAPLMVTAVLIAFGLKRLRASAREARAGQAANLARAREGSRIADLGQRAVQMADPEQFVKQVVATTAETLELLCAAAYHCGDPLTLAASAGELPAPGELRPERERAEICQQPSLNAHAATLDAEQLETISGDACPPGASAVLVSIPRRSQVGGALLAIAQTGAVLGDPEVAFLRTCATLLGAAADRADTDLQLRQAQKMEAVGQLAGSVAHDFNNLLTGILGSAEIARLSLAPKHPLLPLLADIYKAGEHAALLTRQLLAFSRRQALNPELLDAGEIVKGLQRILGRLMGEQVELEVRVPAEPASVLADRSGLEQIVLNLCLNARDAVGRGGHITVEVGLRDRPGESRCRGSGSVVFLSIEDDGCGMNEETRTRIFEPFFTTKGPEHGTGLGLATVHALVGDLGGDIRVSSDVGRGSRFEVQLPLAGGEASEGDAAAAGTGFPGQGEVVLLVEDHIMARRALERSLTTNGYRVRVATDGVEALEALEQHDDVGVVVSDVSMPRMGGDELLQIMRRRSIRVPIVFLSGYPAASDGTGRRTDTLDAPVLTKPVATIELLRVIRSMLDSARQATPAA